MIELTVKDFMEARLPVPVYMEYPENPPDSFVVLRKGDSGRDNLLHSAMIVADSYGPSLLEAARLNELVKAVLDNLILLDSISSSRRGGDYPAYDTKNKRHRYQAVQNLSHY